MNMNLILAMRNSKF